jgi:hypothetical protein
MLRYFLLLVSVVICTAFMLLLSRRLLYIHFIICSPCTCLDFLFRCPFLSVFFSSSYFPPKIYMYLLCLTHSTCQFGPIITAGLSIQIIKLVIIQHPITTLFHTKFFPVPISHTPPVLFTCTGKPDISSVLNLCFGCYILGRRMDYRRFRSGSKHSLNLFCFLFR